MKTYSLREARRLAIGTNDWRQGIWNKWLVGYLMPRADESAESGGIAHPASSPIKSSVESSVSSSSPAVVQCSPTSQTHNTQNFTAAESPAPSAPQRSETLRPAPLDSERLDHRAHPEGLANTYREEADRPSLYPPNSEQGADLGDEWGRARRVHTLRTRLDQMVAQLDGLELALDRQGEREGLARVQDRVQQRALSDILDRLVEAQERHTQSLISCTRAIERFERRLISMERATRSTHSIHPEGYDLDEARYSTESQPESIAPPAATQRIRKPRATTPTVDPIAPLSGKLSEISLPTLLSMAELECWTGRLTLDAGARTVFLDMEAGLLVGVFEDDSPSDAVETLYDLIDARNGGFSFSPQHQVTKTELSPLTVGTLLLRASHRRDEVTRLEVG